MLLAFLAVPYFLSGYSKEDVYITKEFKLNYNLFGQNEYFIHNTNTSKLTENKYETSTQNIKIISNEKVNDKINIEYTSTVDSGYIEVPLLYYPGYVAKDENGKDLEVTLGNNNVVRVNINKKGDGKIKIEYKQKITYILATLVSIVTFVGGIYLLFIKRRSRGELKH